MTKKQLIKIAKKKHKEVYGSTNDTSWHGQMDMLELLWPEILKLRRELKKVKK